MDFTVHISVRLLVTDVLRTAYLGSFIIQDYAIFDYMTVTADVITQ